MIPHRFQKEELQTLKHEIVRELQHIIHEHVKPSDKRWIRSHEVMKMLDISPNTLIKLRDNHAIPYAKLGRLYFYDRIKINQMLADKASERQLRYDKFKIF